MTDKELKDAAKLSSVCFETNAHKSFISFDRSHVVQLSITTSKLLKHIGELKLAIAKLKQERLELIHLVLPVQENP
jgi:hypothetical protein